ncbi:MAG: hypothetical protein NC132_00220 [Corallococcus sp.]|nr:hypothetical protein [Corallococcus sp.]MCM1359149.1 hypothetical protein [Corallococcus sp.]MCM1394539.1 hypothetical protein [Corallococcus sp.]
MNNAFLKSFQTLKSVYTERAFSAIALNKTLEFCTAQDKALVTKLVYGVLDNDMLLQYILSKYVRKVPKGDVLIILKMGVYCLKNLSIPSYAVVDGLAELTKITEDVRQVGFVNATLKNVSKTITNFNDYPDDEFLRVSVVNSYPQWALKKLIKDYGKEGAYKIASFRASDATCVRIANGAKTADLLKNFSSIAPTVFPDAYAVNGKIPPLNGDFTLQSLSSMAVARAAASLVKRNFLDCCAAPGGKSVYVKQLCPSANVTACDIHPHREQLIQSYARRMGANVQTYCLDMSTSHSRFYSAFDTVLCDVPCSGFGVLDNRPDIKLFRESLDISNLMKLQYSILRNAADYVELGGHIVYSTCTVFDNENGQNVRKFLAEYPNFVYGTIIIDELPQTHNKSFYQFLPHRNGMQGFYLAVLKRIK